MAETSLKSQIEQYCKNPHLRNLFMLLYETSTGHDHDGTNSKAVSVGSVGAGLISNTELATDVKVGSLNSLTTTDKDSVVDAINEVVIDVSAASAKVGTLASLTTTAKSNVVVAINEVVTSIAGFASKTGAETLTNKKLTTPVIDDTDAGVTLTSADQTNAAATVTIPDIGDAADTFVMKDTEQTLTLKTLTTPIIASLYQDAGKTKLMTVPNTASDTLAAIAATQTFTNKTLTTPVIASIYIDAGKTKLMSFADVASDTICVIGAAQTLLLKTLTTPIIASIYQDAAKTKLMTIPDTASDTLTANAATQTLTNKTLTTPVIASFYQDAGKTKLMTVPDTASDTLVSLAATQTLTNKTLTAPAVTSPDLTFAASTHDYSGAAADWTLSAAEIKTMFLSTSNSSGATNIIAPTTANKVYVLYNATASACTIKTAAGTGVEVATTKTAIVRCDGTNYVRVTADA